MITEDQLEQLTLAWFQEIGWSYLSGPTIAPDAPEADRTDYRAVVLRGRLAAAERRLKPKLPETAVEDVVHIATTPDHPTLIRSNRAIGVAPTICRALCRSYNRVIIEAK